MGGNIGQPWEGPRIGAAAHIITSSAVALMLCYRIQQLGCSLLVSCGRVERWAPSAIALDVAQVRRLRERSSSCHIEHVGLRCMGSDCYPS